jgi:hypothetical protein
MEEYADIIEKIKKQKTIDPPASFTDSVMRRLPDRSPGILLAVASVFHHLCNQALAPAGDQSIGLTRRECSFYFFITGFFYLIIGIILVVGLQEIDSGTTAMVWIKLQPHLTIGAAIWFLALGVVLKTGGSNGMKIAKYGTLLYIYFAVVNGTFMRLSLHVPFSGMFIVGFVATNAFMGILLALAIQKMELRPV